LKWRKGFNLCSRISLVPSDLLPPLWGCSSNYVQKFGLEGTSPRQKEPGNEDKYWWFRWGTCQSV